MGDRKAGTGGKKREGVKRKRRGGDEEREKDRKKLFAVCNVTTDGKMEVMFNICLMSHEGTYPEFLPKTDDLPETGPQRTPLDQELLPIAQYKRRLVVCDEALSC